MPNVPVKLSDVESTPTKLMTVKDIASVLSVSERVVQMSVKRVCPHKVRNGYTTYLEEEWVTAVKKDLESHHNLEGTFEAVTDLEMIEKAQSVIEWSLRKVSELTKDVERMKPKEIAFDILMRTDDMMSITNAAKHFNMRQRDVFLALRTKGMLTLSDLPTQKAIDADILFLKETVCADNRTRPQAVVKSCQLDKFYKAVK